MNYYSQKLGRGDLHDLEGDTRGVCPRKDTGLQLCTDTCHPQVMLESNKHAVYYHYFGFGGVILSLKP